MCLSIPGQVVALPADRPGVADVDLAGVRNQVDIGLVDGLAEGDWVLVHAGYALRAIDVEEARATLRLLDELARATPGGP